MSQSRRVIAFVNIAHTIDHMFILIFPTAVLAMGESFDRSYGELLALSLGGFIAFGAGSIPSGWLGDKWSRRNMLAVFFIGIGASTILTGFSQSELMLAVALTFIGLFASIYHPVGGALLASHAAKLGRELGINGVWGNLGIAFAALVTAGIAQYLGWRWAFSFPAASPCCSALPSCCWCRTSGWRNAAVRRRRRPYRVPWQCRPSRCWRW